MILTVLSMSFGCSLSFRTPMNNNIKAIAKGPVSDFLDYLRADSVHIRLEWMRRWCNKRPESIDLDRSLVQRMRINQTAVGNTRQNWIRGRLHWFVDDDMRREELERKLEQSLVASTQLRFAKRPLSYDSQIVKYESQDPWQVLQETATSIYSHTTNSGVPSYSD